MKRFFAVIITLAIITGLSACGGKPQYKDGLYHSTVEGRNGDITVAVTVSGSVVADISIESHEEAEDKYNQVVDTLIPDILEKQKTSGVDSVAGATITSKAVLKAVKEILKQAK